MSRIAEAAIKVTGWLFAVCSGFLSAVLPHYVYYYTKNTSLALALGGWVFSVFLLLANLYAERGENVGRD